MTIRIPTDDEVRQGFAAYEAEMLARRTHPLPPDPRDGDEDRLPPVVAARVDLAPAPDPGPDPAPAAPRKPIGERVYCAHCGLRFDHEPRQVALMARGRHVKAQHPETVEAG